MIAFQMDAKIMEMNNVGRVMNESSIALRPANHLRASSFGTLHRVETEIIEDQYE